ncbi:YeiH family protein [Rhizobium sp. C4]|uniref:YeiH family protein n=1 Tax=Rhizobium sp. C4 TaxID=1349800 RepID=UPI001E5B7034|nr:YeiH family protein [Rhizobium sp. C4]MCD2175443.1 YeiH family protein [Rhizobium sp. C4]
MHGADTWQNTAKEALPGIALCSAVAALGYGAQWAETALFGRAWLESLVLAILLGALIRTFLGLHPHFEAGVRVSAKLLLEIAIVLLGASISVSAITGAGPELVAGVAGSVFIAVLSSYTIGRMLKLEHRLALLVACGNSICGNSAIVAVAPVIKARAEDVAASIAFTAALGIFVVLLLPLGQHATGMSAESYGILSGMTVYAVPQVLAATAPVGLLSMQTGTLVKLIRVMMLAPVIFCIGLLGDRSAERTETARRIEWAKIIPWFIIGFVAMMALRSAGMIPDQTLDPLETLATALTIVSMAALGLSVDMRTILSSGGRVLAAGTLSLGLLVGISLILLHLLGIR